MDIPPYAIPLVACAMLLALAVVLGIISVLHIDDKRKGLRKNLIIVLITASVFEFGFTMANMMYELEQFEVFLISSAIIVGGFVAPAIYFIKKWERGRKRFE